LAANEFMQLLGDFWKMPRQLQKCHLENCPKLSLGLGLGNPLLGKIEDYLKVWVALRLG